MRLNQHRHLHLNHQVLLYGVFILTASLVFSSPAFATSFNFLADGETFDIEGMFDCSQEILECTELTISNWMFTQVGGSNDGLSFTSSNPDHTLVDFQFEPFSSLTVQSPSTNSGILSQEGFIASFRDGVEDGQDRPAFQATPKATKPIPEPGTVLLCTTGLLALAGYRWHHRRREATQVG